MSFPVETAWMAPDADHPARRSPRLHLSANQEQVSLLRAQGTHTTGFEFTSIACP